MINNMRILGIDYGDVRTGVAITDPLGITAQGLKTINSQNSDRILLRELEEIVTEYNVEKIKFNLGIPLIIAIQLILIFLIFGRLY